MIIILSAITGTLCSALLACVPGLHVYNVMAVIIIALYSFQLTVPPEILIPCAMSMMVGYSMLNTIPSVIFAAPDESSVFTVLPGQKYLMTGRGFEGVIITAAGGLTGLFILLFIIGPTAPFVLPVMQSVIRPHVHWILWCIICFMLMSEWPKTGRLGQGGWRKFLNSCKTTSAGLLTFLLSGLLGFILIYKSPIPVNSSFQNLMPAFIGLFTMPWLILNIISNVRIPPQQFSTNMDRTAIAKGTAAGALGGMFSAFIPVVTAGVGGFLAGHATAIRDDRAFLTSQGTSKLIYYTGTLLFFFLPNLTMTRGGAAWMISGIYTTSSSYYDYYIALASVAISGCTAFLLVGPITRYIITFTTKYGFHNISIISLSIAAIFVITITGWIGFLITLTATAIGLIPVLYGSRRMNCLGIILLPIACNMSGLGQPIAKILGLL